MRRDVRILLVGDGKLPSYHLTWENVVTPFRNSRPEGVGKSTIVTSLIKESYVAHVSLFLLTKSTGLHIPCILE